MRCGRVRKLLSAYIDGRTNDRQRLYVGLHLFRCRDCRQQYEDLRRLRLVLLAGECPAVPDGFTAAWQSRIREEAAAGQTKTRLSWILRPAVYAPAAVCLILVLAGVAFIKPRVAGDQYAATLDKQIEPPAAAAEEAPSSGASTAGRTATPSADNVPPTTSAGTDFSGGPVAGDSEPLTRIPPRMGAADFQETDRIASLGAAKPPQMPVETDSRIKITGTWRVWLTATGGDLEAVRDVLVELGLDTPDISGDLSDQPVLLCMDLTHAEAQAVAGRLEEVGAYAMLELVPQ